MDYKEKYKEALAKAKDMLNYKEVRAEDIEYIFPELAESEDERVRKELIEFVKSRGGFKQEYIAWLKKQGTKEVDPRYENLEELLVADNIYQMSMNEEMVEEAKSKAINALSELEISELLGLEKQCEQKPWSEGDEQNLNACLGYIPDEFLRRWLKDIIHIKYDKTSLSEEDENAIGMAIIALEDMYDEDEPNTTYCGYNLPFNKAAERLKSLKDRVQPKQEWSEEDEKMCQETIDWFERKCFPFALENENPARKSIIWLKSLKEKINL